MATRRIAPAHLSARSQTIFRAIRKDYALESKPHALEVLRMALESLDRADQAREILKTDGITFTDQSGQPKPHPAVAIERDSQIRAARMFRELALDASDYLDSRPPRPGGGF